MPVVGMKWQRACEPQRLSVHAAHEPLVWLILQFDKFPRARRFTLGERLEADVLAILERLIGPVYTRFPSFRRTPESRAALKQFGIQVSPFWVGLFDQLQFPFALPLFDGSFTCNRCYHALMRFEPYKRVDAVALGKAFDECMFVLPDALNQIGRYTDVNRSLSTTRQNIYAWLLVHWLNVLDSGVRRNDGLSHA